MLLIIIGITTKNLKDYEYLDNFGKRLLSDLAVFLNKLHKVNHSSIFWEILLGEWLHSLFSNLIDTRCSI